MTLVLRKIRKARWDSQRNRKRPPAGEASAHAMRDFMPDEPRGGHAEEVEDCISVWLVHDKREDLSRILAALAATWQKPDKLDYVLFADGQLGAAQVETREVAGDTPDQGINRQHRDLIDMWASRVYRLTDRVWHEHVEIKRLAQSEVLKVLADSVRRGRIALGDLSGRLRSKVEDLVRHSDDQPDEQSSNTESKHDNTDDEGDKPEDPGRKL